MSSVKNEAISLEEYNNLVKRLSEDLDSRTNSFVFCNSIEEINTILKKLNIKTDFNKRLSICKFPISHYEFRDEKIIFYNNYNDLTQYEVCKEVLNVYIIDNILLFETDFFDDLNKVYLIMFYLENKIADSTLFKQQIEMEKTI